MIVSIVVLITTAITFISLTIAREIHLRAASQYHDFKCLIEIDKEPDEYTSFNTVLKHKKKRFM